MATLEQKRQARFGVRPGGLVAALDIGCSKITCLICEVDPAVPGELRLRAVGSQQSRGFTGTGISDLEALERAVRLAVEDAERGAGERIEKVTVGLTSPKVMSHALSARIEVAGREISRKDIHRVQAAALSALPREAGKAGGRRALSGFPVGYTVDDQPGVRQPAGMIARALAVDLHVITAPLSLIGNLEECLARAQLRIDQVVPSALASGLGTLIEDERENGALCIDLGAGVTSACAFINHAPAWLGLVPVGGNHVTADIAQGIGTTFAAAERLKTIHGHADLTSPGLAERIECPRLGEDGRLNAARMARGDLVRIIVPRLEEIFELVRRRVEASPIARRMPRRVVLTGGASQLPGLRDLASRVLDMPVRLGRPQLAENLGDAAADPGFSTAAGLVTYAETGRSDVIRAGITQAGSGGSSAAGMVNRTMSWIRENF